MQAASLCLLALAAVQAARHDQPHVKSFRNPKEDQADQVVVNDTEPLNLNLKKVETDANAERMQLEGELHESLQLKDRLLATAHQAQVAKEEFLAKEQAANNLHEELDVEKRKVGQEMDGIQMEAKRASKAIASEKVVESQFEVERRKNGELMDALNQQRWKIAQDAHAEQAKEVMGLHSELQQENAKNAELVTENQALEKKVVDLGHAKDLWKSAAESARKVMKQMVAKPVAKPAQPSPAAPKVQVAISHPDILPLPSSDLGHAVEAAAQAYYEGNKHVDITEKALPPVAQVKKLLNQVTIAAQDDESEDSDEDEVTTIMEAPTANGNSEDALVQIRHKKRRV